MKLKLLLFLFLISAGVLNAQDTIRSLVISEFRAGGEIDTYVELTNMGDEPVNLNQFKFGAMRPWAEALENLTDPWVTGSYFFLPEYMLEPDSSYVITGVRDFGPEQYRKKVPGFEDKEREMQPEMWDLADLIIHMPEVKGDETDSVTTTFGTRQGEEPNSVIINWRGRSAFFIEQHLNETDSLVIDQVSGVFDNAGQNQDVQYDVAGVEGAVSNSTLVRKYSVKQGNIDFANARGVGLDDSEWMPIPQAESKYRKLPWTIGNHGPYNFDENTLQPKSDMIDVDFSGRTITVPWGVRRGDDIMDHMEYTPGVFWKYVLSPSVEDSTSFAAATGDKLVIYVCGNDLDVDSFNIVVSEPTADANMLVPVSDIDPDGNWRDDNEYGILDWPRITRHESGIDSITGNWYGIPYGTRVDSLLERLEKPANATWEIVWADGVDERADFIEGDILRVTSENGTAKDYYIQVRSYQPSHNATLSSITWPDIPEFYKGIFGWVGDTIPGFNPNSFNYKVQIPYDVEGIPALVAKTQQLNATVEVKRAVNLAGSLEERTVQFIVTAEDDSVMRTYNVELVKEKAIENVQPFNPDPFISELVFRDQWANGFVELVNPGNVPLDMSDYMIVNIYSTNPTDGITWYSAATEEDWLNRYSRYVPGYKWVDLTQWQVTPARLVEDLNVSPLVQPGDVFVLGTINTDRMRPGDWWTGTWAPDVQLDVQFNNVTVPETGNTFSNPWGEEVNETIGESWSTSNYYLYKILNDSVKNGLKPANDPNDFELLEAWGMSDGSNWVVGGESTGQITNYMRKPEVWHGNPDLEGSFGTNWDDSEWTMTNRSYWQGQNAPWPGELFNIDDDLGQHFMIEPTHYKSTVTSSVYIVSPGYSLQEEIRGPRTDQTVADLLSNVVKAHPDQMLSVLSAEDGSVLGMDELLTMNDTLLVIAADSVYRTKYRLYVTEEGLSSNAVLESDRYTIEITDQPMSVTENAEAADNHVGSGNISGFEYGTELETVLDNIEVPAGASLTILDEEGAYVPLTVLNFDTAVSKVTVRDNIYFEVVAENGVTTILYQLLPETTESSALLFSDVYSVDQKDQLVQYVPGGTTVSTFLSNVYPSTGATVKVVDKLGMEKSLGGIVQDDKVVVTSPNGDVQTVYFIGMLPTEYVTETTYLAYVTSSVYNVDQMKKVITGASGSTDIATFYNRIDPAMGASVMIVDADGNEKTTGNLSMGDMLKVVSADGRYEAMYTVDIGTSSNFTADAQISVYPNPTSGKVNISGVEVGGRIQVFNSMGSRISEVEVQRSIETVTLDSQPAGMYLIVVSNAGSKLGQFKVLKK